MCHIFIRYAYEKVYSQDDRISQVIDKKEIYSTKSINILEKSAKLVFPKSSNLRFIRAKKLLGIKKRVGRVSVAVDFLAFLSSFLP